jgi:tetratricopeptide (TPR) repeat protein
LHDALAIDSQCAPAHFNLAEILAGRGQIRDGIDHYQRALKVDPKFGSAHCDLGIALLAEPRRDLVDQLYPEGNRELDLARGNALKESARRFNEVFNIDPDWTIADNAVRLSEADSSRLKEAIAHYRRAIELGPLATPPTNVEPLLAKAYAALGQALAAQWEFAAAEAAFRRSLDFHPLSYEKWPPNIEKQIARCKQMSRLESRLPAALASTDRSTDDWLPLAQLCYVRGHYATAVEFYAKAFVASKELADDCRTGHRFNAACAAALAAAGKGNDAAGRADSQKRSWRRQTHEWLERDLEHWTELISAGGAGGSVEAGWFLTSCREAAELASLRGQRAIDLLPPDERDEWRTLWRHVDELIEQSRMAAGQRS